MHSFLNYQNVGLGVLIVAVASLLFATGATIQHLAAATVVDPDAENKSMNLKQLWRLITTPRWLGGLALITIGALAHITALMMAPVTVVQPVGILAVPWSVLMAAKIHRHKVTGTMWFAVLLTVVGVVGFTVISGTNAALDTRVEPPIVILGCVVIYAIGAFFGMLGWRGKNGMLRSMMWATGGSFFYGLSSALIKSVSVMMRDAQFQTSPLFWVIVPFLVGCYLIGGAMIQQGYATGPAETVVASMTVTDPIVGVSFGLIILGEGVLISLLEASGMVVAAAIAVYGVFLLSKHHPDAVERREAQQSAVGSG
ncbi:hypothetical protein [Nigerium massiliense]|uniref:hypothetical protein n=1 Tax=Nigerium massiliense TaxID=1522317 RepID=UPI0011CCBB6F|nr:hypothetical protein [Nigerium massiliense]